MSTMRIDKPRMKLIDKKAVEMSVKNGRPISAPDVVRAAIDRALKLIEPDDFRKE